MRKIELDQVAMGHNVSVTLKNGDVLEGEVTKVNKSSLIIGEERINAARIESVKASGRPSSEDDGSRLDTKALKSRSRARKKRRASKGGDSGGETAQRVKVQPRPTSDAMLGGKVGALVQAAQKCQGAVAALADLDVAGAKAAVDEAKVLLDEMEG